ncbi:MAG: Iron-sulfur cluster assembly protein SufD, partial [uncultured Lysobacter sp.]
ERTARPVCRNLRGVATARCSRARRGTSGRARRRTARRTATQPQRSMALHLAAPTRTARVPAGRRVTAGRSRRARGRALAAPGIRQRALPCRSLGSVGSARGRVAAAAVAGAAGRRRARCLVPRATLRPV